MSKGSEIRDSLDRLVSAEWSQHSPRTVPSSDDVALANGSALIDATYLYADLADSSSLAQSVPAGDAARVIRMYLDISVRVLRHMGGEIRSFDGDRVMAIFMGDSKNSNAFRAALAINWYVIKDIGPRIATHLPTVSNANWTLEHGIGIDTGEALLVRGGVRNNNDLVSVGSAPNVAAKLADVRDLDPIHITSRSFDRVKEDFRKKASTGETRARECGYRSVGGASLHVMSSGWLWEL